MKYIYILLAFISVQSAAHAQASRGIPKDSIPYVNNFRLRIFQPTAFGDNAIAQDTQPNIGFGVNFALVNYKKFHFVLGGDVTGYSVKESQFLGNFKTIQEFRGSFQVEYEALIKKNWRVLPLVGFGLSHFNNYKPKSGGYAGRSFFTGGILNYGINRDYSFSFGVNYLYASYDLNTISSQASYLNNSHQLIFSLSVNFR